MLTRASDGRRTKRSTETEIELKDSKEADTPHGTQATRSKTCPKRSSRPKCSRTFTRRGLRSSGRPPRGRLEEETRGRLTRIPFSENESEIRGAATEKGACSCSTILKEARSWTAIPGREIPWLRLERAVVSVATPAIVAAQETPGPHVRVDIRAAYRAIDPSACGVATVYICT